MSLFTSSMLGAVLAGSRAARVVLNVLALLVDAHKNLTDLVAETFKSTLDRSSTWQSEPVCATTPRMILS
eukprot:9936991-Heterocapsa_arctica.AAC.1